MHTLLIYPGVSVAIKSIYLVLFSSTPLYPSEYSVLQVPVNYHGNSLCNKRTYQPYMERQETTLVILRVMNVCTSLIWSVSTLLW